MSEISPFAYDLDVSPRSRDLKAMAAFGSVVRERRKAQRLTQAELAERAHVERETLGRIERGLREPGLSIIIRLAQALGVKPGKLIDAMENETHVRRP